jgi:hypothetical protein
MSAEAMERLLTPARFADLLLTVHAEIAGILQVEMRQRVSGVCMLMTICCEGSIR